VTTLSPDGADEAQRRGLRVLLGDSSRTRTMEEAGIRRAGFVVIADDEPETAARIAGVAHALNPEAKVVVRTRYHSDTGDMKAAGATYVVSDETEGMATLSEKLLTHYDVAFEQIEELLSTLRAPAAVHAAETQPRSRFTRTVVDTESLVDLEFDREACEHVADARAVVPGAPGCEECLRDGTEWVHLRLCMECGHVGCCDSSPNRHSRRHWEGTGHPIVRSAEPGERWGHCFPDDLRLEPVRSPA
jgi:CPA2 family monovalent cation:H+ antiporter-2